MILYLQMPVMNGLEAARQIAEMAPGPVMLMNTVHCSEQLLKDAQAAGIQKVLLQESLTNVHRHSGASRVHVQLTPEKQRLTLTVRDFGSGMPAETLAAFQRNGGNGGVGLRGMRERVNDLGG